GREAVNGAGDTSPKRKRGTDATSSLACASDLCPMRRSGLTSICLPGLQDFGQRILREWNPQSGHFLQAPPGPGDAVFLLGDKGRVELLLGEQASAADRREGWIDDVLRRGRVAADMPFALRGQGQWRYLPQDITQVQVRIGDGLNVHAADVAEIALIADCHDDPPARAG